MIDCHCHILPNIDDGPTSMEESIKMAKKAFEKGTHTIISTTHFYDEKTFKIGNDLRISLDLFKEELKKNSIDLNILLGNEAFISPKLPTYVKEEKVYTLNSSRYLLVELPLMNMPMYAFSVLYKLKLQGITPIIAHPERYSYVLNDPNIVYEFIDNGSLIQLNEGSLRGRLGEDVKEVAKKLLKHHMVHMIGSDGHGMEKRRPCMHKCYDLVKSIMGENYARDLFYKNPEKICKDEIINIREPVKIKDKSLFRRKIDRIFKLM